jgi:hypothetical protein
VLFVVHNEDVLAIGQDGEILQVLAGADFLKDSALPELDERQGAAALIGDAQDSALVEKRCRHRTTQPGGRLRRARIALRADGATQNDGEANSCCPEKTNCELPVLMATEYVHFFHSPTLYFFQKEGSGHVVNSIFPGDSLLVLGSHTNG